MNCNGIINVTCDKCAMLQQISCSILEDWQEVSEDQGAQGKEIQHEAIAEHECSVCGNKIEVKASIWTYPNMPAIKPDCFNVDNVDGAEYNNHNCNCS